MNGQIHFPHHLDAHIRSRYLRGFFITKNPLSFSLFSTLAPPIYLWYRFTKHVFPLDEKTFELAKMRIQMKAQNNKHAH